MQVGGAATLRGEWNPWVLPQAGPLLMVLYGSTDLYCIDLRQLSLLNSTPPRDGGF